MANRTQLLVLGFFLLVWTSLVALLAAAPAVYDQALTLPRGERRPAELAFLACHGKFVKMRRGQVPMRPAEMAHSLFVEVEAGHACGHRIVRLVQASLLRRRAGEARPPPLFRPFSAK